MNRIAAIALVIVLLSVCVSLPPAAPDTLRRDEPARRAPDTFYCGNGAAPDGDTTHANNSDLMSSVPAANKEYQLNASQSIKWITAAYSSGAEVAAGSWTANIWARSPLGTNILIHVSRAWLQVMDGPLIDDTAYAVSNPVNPQAYPASTSLIATPIQAGFGIEIIALNTGSNPLFVEAGPTNGSNLVTPVITAGSNKFDTFHFTDKNINNGDAGAQGVHILNRSSTGGSGLFGILPSNYRRFSTTQFSVPTTIPAGTWKFYLWLKSDSTQGNNVQLVGQYWWNNTQSGGDIFSLFTTINSAPSITLKTVTFSQTAITIPAGFAFTVKVINAGATYDINLLTHDVSQLEYSYISIPATAIVPLTVTVTAPNGSENWTAGTIHNIAWTTSGGFGAISVDIGYSTTGVAGPYTTLATSAPNTGTYQWTMPDLSPAKFDCYVSINATDQTPQTASDASNGNFTIWKQPPLTVQLLRPNGLENWSVDASHDIMWVAYGGNGTLNVSLAYSIYGASGPYKNISSSVLNNGSYPWFISGVQRSYDCYVRLSVTDNSTPPKTINVTSTANFTIWNDTYPSLMALLYAPSGYENWSSNASHKIIWDAFGGNGTISIELDFSTDGGTTYTPIITATPNSGSYYWFINGEPTSTTCYVRLTAIDQSIPSPEIVSVASAANFTIWNSSAVPLSLVLYTPNGNENWTSNASHDITWAASGGTGNLGVDLDYSTNGAGGTYKSIATSIANSGSYPWFISGEPTSNNSFVRITVTDESVPPQGITLTSASNFTIWNDTAVSKPLALSLSTPNGGENWTTGTTQVIIWNANWGVSPITITIEYSTEGPSGNLALISDSVANTGVYSWSVPSIPTSNDCYMKVTATDSASTPDVISKQSNNKFTIFNSAISQQIDHVTVSPDSVLIATGDSQQFNAIAWANAGETQNVAGVTFSWSVTRSIGVVDSTGFFAAQLEDTGQVVAAAGSRIGSATVKVVSTPPVLDHVIVTPAGPMDSVNPGAHVDFVAQAYSGTNDPIGGTVVYNWSTTGGVGTVSPQLNTQTTGFTAASSALTGDVVTTAAYRGVSKDARVNITVSAPVKKGAIFGVVTDTNSSSPIEGAVVRLYIGSPQVNVKNASTIANGSYAFTGLSAGTYTVTVTKTGYKSASQEVSVSSGEFVRLDILLESSGTGDGSTMWMYILIVVVILFVIIVAGAGAASKSRKNAAEAKEHKAAYTHMMQPAFHHAQPANHSMFRGTLPSAAHATQPVMVESAPPVQKVEIREEMLNVDEELDRLDALRKEGIISQEEYELTRSRLLKMAGRPVPHHVKTARTEEKPKPEEKTKPSEKQKTPPKPVQIKEEKLESHEELERLRALRDEGIISDEEYELAKKIMLESGQKKAAAAAAATTAVTQAASQTATATQPGVTPPEAPPATSAAPPESAGSEVTHVACPKCGKKNDPNDTECFFCGTALK